MSEKVDLQPDINRPVAQSDLSESKRILKSRAVGRNWSRIVQGKAGPDTQAVVEEVRPLGRSNRMPAAFQWVRVSWMRRWSKNRAAKKLNPNLVGTHEHDDNMTAFMTMAKYAITLAVESEPEVDAQAIKRRTLMNRWRNTYERVFSQNSR
ncbi:MAG: hypothetical protein ABWX94_00200 [Candidatus Saccharimonadales bacterium]